MSRYRSVKDENCVDYISFNDEVESVFTVNELEKMPTIQVIIYYIVYCQIIIR